AERHARAGGRIDDGCRVVAWEYGSGAEGEEARDGLAVDPVRRDRAEALPLLGDARAVVRTACRKRCEKQNDERRAHGARMIASDRGAREVARGKSLTGSPPGRAR